MLFIQPERKVVFFVKDHPYIIPVKFGQIRPSSFREDFFLISQSKSRIVPGGHVVYSTRKEEFLWTTTNTTFL